MYIKFNNGNFVEESLLGSVKSPFDLFSKFFSLRCHQDQLVSLIQSFSMKRTVICLCETQLNDNDPPTLHQRDRYQPNC